MAGMGPNEKSQETSGDLDEALNELGMLSTVTESRRDFLREKWARRGRPVRDKDREGSWGSSSTSTSTSSSGSSSSRRSSSSSSCSTSGSSFASLSYSRSYSRTSLTSYSIAENSPTSSGVGPSSGPSSSSGYQSKCFSSTSSLCSSLDLEQTVISSSSLYKSMDFPKVVRRPHKNYKPYSKPRRFSLQLGIHREEPSSLGSDTNLSFSRGLNLSDSEASSGTGSGTGTPPPHPHPQHSLGPGSGHEASFISQFGCRTGSNSAGLAVKERETELETQSDPNSPTAVIEYSNAHPFSAHFEQQSHSLPFSRSPETQHNLEAEREREEHLHLNPQTLIRSKSLDDLNLLLFQEEEASIQRQQNLVKLFPMTTSRPPMEGSPSCDTMIESVLQKISRLEM